MAKRALYEKLSKNLWEQTKTNIKIMKNEKLKDVLSKLVYLLKSLSKYI